MTTTIQHLTISGPAGDIALKIQGDPSAPAVFMTHSILSSSMMWDEQAALLAAKGYRAIRADTRGHGASHAGVSPYTMGDLVADTVAALDALKIERAHYIGLSLGGMSGLGLGIAHANRLLSLCICDARADAPPAVAAPWDERIAIALKDGCAVLAQPTIERWFGTAFLDANPAIADRFRNTASATSAVGFIGSARAIQGLDYLSQLLVISTRTTLIVGANDGPLPQAMKDMQALISGAALEVIPGSGHLPNIDNPQAFNAAMLRHFSSTEK